MFANHCVKSESLIMRPPAQKLLSHAFFAVRTRTPYG